MKHFAGITVPAIFNNGNVDVNHIAVLEAFFVGDAVTYNLINRGTYGLWEAVVVQWSRDSLLLIDDIVMTNLVEFVGSYAYLRRAFYLFVRLFLC